MALDPDDPYKKRIDRLAERYEERLYSYTTVPAHELRREANDHHLALNRWLLASLLAINGGAIVAIGQFESLLPELTIPLVCFALGIIIAMLSAITARQAAVVESDMYLEYLQIEKYKTVLVDFAVDPIPDEKVIEATHNLKALTAKMSSVTEANEQESKKLPSDFFDQEAQGILKQATNVLTSHVRHMERREAVLDGANEAEGRIEKLKAKRRLWVPTSLGLQISSLAFFCLGCGLSLAIVIHS